MCLAVPGRVVEWLDTTPTFAQARVDFGGVQRSVSMVCMPEVQLGEYVLVHAGIAIARLDEEEAARVLETLRQLELDDELSEDHRDFSELAPPRLEQHVHGEQPVHGGSPGQEDAE